MSDLTLEINHTYANVFGEEFKITGFDTETRKYLTSSLMSFYENGSFVLSEPTPFDLVKEILTPAIPSRSFSDPDASHRIVGKSPQFGSGILGYYYRSEVGDALAYFRVHDAEADFRVEPHNPRVQGKMLRTTDVEWIVNNHGELGVKIGDQVFFLHRGQSLMYDTDTMSYRPVEKKEFGETVRAPDFKRYTHHQFTSEYDRTEDGEGFTTPGWRPIDPSLVYDEEIYINP